jgi:MscS family membrane protein
LTISDEVLNSIYILLGTWIVSSLAHNIILNYGHNLAEKGEGHLNDRPIEFLELTARYVIWFIGIMLILVNLDVNITPFSPGRVSLAWHLHSLLRTLSPTLTAELLLRLTSH